MAALQTNIIDIATKEELPPQQAKRRRGMLKNSTANFVGECTKLANAKLIFQSLHSGHSAAS